MKRALVTSLDLHLRFQAEEIVETECLKDVGAGIYPCYYIRDGDRLKVSTSASSLVIDSGDLVPDPEFAPPDFLRWHFRQHELTFRLERKFRHVFGLPKIKEMDPWYESSRSVDARVSKLSAFESVTATSTASAFRPDFSIRNREVIVEQSVRHVLAFIEAIEGEFPDHHNVIMTGGKDSQLILLAPKRNPDRWHFFSAEPNYSLNVKWMAKNGVRVNRTFFHDNRNEESGEDLRRKIVCGDLYSDPTHIRWMPTVRKIAREFDERCLFWGGTMSSPAHFYAGGHRADFTRDREAFFRSHFGRTAAFQGNYHQVFKNFTGLPYLSPYHSSAIWDELYQHIDPAIYTNDEDLRIQIGEKLFGKPVWWPEANPGPDDYAYPRYLNARKTYLEHIRSSLKQ